MKGEASLGSRAWNLSLTPASLSPDMRLTSTAELLSIDSLALSGQAGEAPCCFFRRAEAHSAAWKRRDDGNSAQFGDCVVIFAGARM